MVKNKKLKKQEKHFFVEDDVIAKEDCREVKVTLSDLKSISTSLADVEMKLHEAKGVVDYYLEQQEESDD